MTLTRNGSFRYHLFGIVRSFLCQLISRPCVGKFCIFLLFLIFVGNVKLNTALLTSIYDFENLVFSHIFCLSKPSYSKCHSPTKALSSFVICLSHTPFRPVFLNRRAAARYRALASIIPGCEKFSWNLSF